MLVGGGDGVAGSGVGGETSGSADHMEVGVSGNVVVSVGLEVGVGGCRDSSRASIASSKNSLRPAFGLPLRSRAAKSLLASCFGMKSASDLLR